jgi:hypothetical protein
MSHALADTLRIQSQVKRLVLLGQLRLPLSVARRIVGPDCAFHLYARSELGATRARRTRRRRVATR